MEQPIYQQIINRLKEQIDTLPANTAILSEREMAEEFNVSRMTVRKAVRKLVEEGYLYRDGNKGTFVADQNLHKKNLFSGMMEQFAADDGTYRILYFDVKTGTDSVDERVAEKLELQSLDTFVRIVRLNKIADIPESIDEIYIAQKFLQKQEILTSKKLLEFSSTIEAGSVKQEFIPMIVPIQYTNLLHLEMNTPIILVESTIYTKDGKVYAIIRSYVNPKKKKIEITV